MHCCDKLHLIQITNIVLGHHARKQLLTLFQTMTYRHDLNPINLQQLTSKTKA
jgi:hypothetical protein